MEKTKYKHDRALILSGGGGRGAYEIGVWRYLCEMNWKPDIICGTSVGSINGAAITAGFSLDDLINLWKSIEYGSVFRISLWRRIKNFVLRKGFTPLMDTRPLRKLITGQLDIEKIRTSDIELVISAVNILTSEIRYFINEEIDIDHIMASSAIPVLFPWQYIDGEPYWDGGVMANTPIAPAIEREAREIIVILLSPVGGARLALPKNQRESIERLFEHALIGSYEAFRSHISQDQKGRGLVDVLLRGMTGKGDVRIATVAPGEMLGFYSMLNFSKKQAEELISAGYEDARNQLAKFFRNA